MHIRASADIPTRPMVGGRRGPDNGSLISAQHTSVPRWEEVPLLDRTGRSFAIVSVGELARPIAGRWMKAARRLRAPSWKAHSEQGDQALLDALGTQLARARIGWRLMLSGPELDVLRLRAVAIDAGAIGAEIRVHVTAARRRRVYCVHCRTTSEEEVQIGGELKCEGCERHLLVYHHVSRRLGAYMGFMADAEAPR